MAKPTSFISSTTAHLRRNKWKYIAVGTVAAVGAGAYVMLRNTPMGDVAAAATDAMLEGMENAGEVVAVAAEAAAEAVA